jgi:hypothetical protein
MGAEWRSGRERERERETDRQRGLEKEDAAAEQILPGALRPECLFLNAYS